MTTDNHTKTTPIDPAGYGTALYPLKTRWQQNGLHWEARLWDVAEGYPLTPDEAQRLAEWVAYTVDT
jgi:hypothetical protein